MAFDGVYANGIRDLNSDEGLNDDILIESRVGTPDLGHFVLMCLARYL